MNDETLMANSMRLLSITLLLTVLCGRPAGALELGPRAVVRQFCRLDALGVRASQQGAARIRDLESWPLEPAWDQIVLIKSYTVGPSRPLSSGVFAVEVRYEVVSRLTAAGLEASAHEETVDFEVGSAAAGEAWRILSPLLPPHVMTTQVDVARAQQDLREGGTSFVANSVFVSRMFAAAGWTPIFQVTEDLSRGPMFRPVETPEAGDVVVFERDGVAYHSGLLDGEGALISSTLNLGLVRSSLDAFPGHVSFLRLVAAEPRSDSIADVATPVPTSRPAQPKKLRPASRK